jgi:hypothetical protein
MGWILVVLTIIALFMVYRSDFNREVAKEKEVQALKKCPSEIYVRMLVQYDKPPIYQEEYRMQDINGVSSASYRIRSFAGKEVTIEVPPRQETDVSFFFGRLVQDGIWNLVNKPPRGHTNPTYTLYVKQKIDCKQGDRTITFTDPHYWATTAGHQFHIDLSKGSPKDATDLLRLQSTAEADPHYQTLVNDFRAFGPDTFRAKVDAARTALASGH